MKIGAFTGKFYPPHVGHLSAVDYALNFCDQVIIVISKNDIRNKNIQKETGFDILDAKLIKSWFDEFYKDNSRVHVEILDESGLGPYPDSLKEWADIFKKQFPQVNVKIADESYRDYNEKYFPECEFLSIDRDQIPVHATNLRDDLDKYFDYLIPTAKEYFKTKLNKWEKYEKIFCKSKLTT